MWQGERLCGLRTERRRKEERLVDILLTVSVLVVDEIPRSRVLATTERLLTS